MALHSLHSTIVLLLSLLTGGSVLLSPLVSFGEHAGPCFLLEEETDSDDVEESLGSLASKLVAMLPSDFVLEDATLLHFVSDEVNHQIEWLFVHEHAARAPPLG